jgi:hypothetical protein
MGVAFHIVNRFHSLGGEIAGVLGLLLANLATLWIHSRVIRVGGKASLKTMVRGASYFAIFNFR